MRRLLDLFARPATRHPIRVLAGLLVVTVGLGWFASRVEMEVDLSAFADEGSETVAALDRVRSEFGVAENAIQVLVDAGPGGDVLAADGIRAVASLEHGVADLLGDRVRVDTDGTPAIRSLSRIVTASLDDRGVDLADASDEQTRAAITRLLEQEPQLARFTSFERDLDVPQARATLLLVEVASDLTEDEAVEAARDVQVRFADGGATTPGGDAYRVLVFSTGLLMEGLLAEIEREMPTLLALALLVVLGVLLLVLRSPTDVVVGLVGLVTIVLWTFGVIAILGPGYLGLRGQFSQIGIVVPVLLVGLGIDYLVHLTYRYREQRAAGDGPALAAHRSVHTVGAALVLATGATAVGFASSSTAPLDVLADVGIFTAAGVVCGFVVMLLLVPSVNTLRRRPSAASVRLGSRRASPRSPSERVFAVPVRLATRTPAAALVVGGLLAGAALIASTDLETTFDAGDFVPEDSDVGRIYATQHELFGGDLAETTYVIVDGDLGDPALVTALLASHRALTDVEDVRTIGDEAQARSIATLALAAARELTGDPDPDLAELVAGIDDLRPLYGQLRSSVGAAVVDELLSRDADAGVVQIPTMAGTGSAAERMRDDIVTVFDPVVSAGATITVVSEQLVVSEMADELRRFQGRSILVALGAVLVLLVGYYGVARRRPFLGLAALLPAAFSVSMLFGSMRVLGISFNPVTSTITAISLGIGVPYGIHLVNRFTEELARGSDPVAACRSSIERTGMALAGSALTTLGAFVVLSTSGLVPVRQLGTLGALSITFALLGALLLQPGALLSWARWRERRAARSRRP